MQLHTQTVSDQERCDLPCFIKLKWIIEAENNSLTVAFLGILELGVLRPRLTRLDGPLVQVLLQTHKATVWQYWVAAVRVWTLGVGRTGVGVVVRQQVVLSSSVDGAVDGTVVGRRAALLWLVRVVDDTNCWTANDYVTLAMIIIFSVFQYELFHRTFKVSELLLL